MTEKQLEKRTFEELKDRITKLGSFPSSERCFNDVFNMAFGLIKEYGTVLSKVFIKESVLFLDKDDLTEIMGLKYHHPRLAENESISIAHFFEDEELEITMERRLGHLTLNREMKEDSLALFLRGVTSRELIKGLGEFQPYQLSIKSLRQKPIIYNYI